MGGWGSCSIALKWRCGYDRGGSSCSTSHPAFGRLSTSVAFPNRSQSAGVAWTGPPFRVHIHPLRVDEVRTRAGLHEKKGPTMKALSEQLTDLAARSKKTEDVVAAAREKNRAKLESERDKLKTSIADRNAKAQERAASAEAKRQEWWSEARSSVDARFATMRAEADERRAEEDINKAERHAEQAEQDAADAIDWALYVLDQAEYSVIDAVIARADADDL